ncbi:MAG: 50S ribosomal protein L9 [Erysipelotrichales bacterium]|nr:50S ribosomal protein L9 [Erysipelotrichales bacterium]
MKVILLADVKNVGKKGEIVEVANGYANNFLIRNRKAVAYTKGSMNVLQKQKEDAAEAEAKAVAEAEELKKKIEEIKLTFPVKVGKEGKTFGSISTKAMTEALSKQYGLTVDKKKFVDTASLDTPGFHKVRVELHKGVIAVLTVRLLEE